MKLELYIRGRFMIAVELKMPAKDPYIDFKSNYEVREQYVKFMIAALKNKYQRAIENSEWEIYLVAESKVGELLSFEEYPEKNVLKKVI